MVKIIDRVGIYGILAWGRVEMRLVPILIYFVKWI